MLVIKIFSDRKKVFRERKKCEKIRAKREEALADRKEYIDLIDTSVRAIIKEEVNSQLPQILPQAVSKFATLVIERNITESLEAVVLAKSSSQPKSTYEAAASLSEFELTKVIMDKMAEHKSYLRSDYKRELYDALVKSYNTDKDLFDTYGEVFTLKRSRDDKDKDQDPSAGSDQGTKRRKSSQDAESSRDPKSKESKSTSSSKGTSLSQHKSSGKSAHAEEPSHTVGDSGISNIARTENPPTSFDELMDTPIDFSVFVMNRLNIINLTQELLVGPAFNLLKGTCKIRTELEYHFEECFKATTERLDWHNPEGKQYPFDLRKPLPLIPNHRGRHVIPFDYVINNDLEYLKDGSLSKKYSTFVTKTKAVAYEVQWIEDMVPNIWSPVKTYCHSKAVEDLQLGVESYQKKLNLTKPDTFRSNLRNRTAYTAYSDPQGVIYKDHNNINRLMRTDELHKFSDGTLNYVWTALHDITSGIRMEYLPKRKWSGLDKRRAHVMIQDIDKQLFQRRSFFLMRTASTTAKPCQGGSLEFYLIIGNPDGRSYWIKTSQDSKPHAHT
ncbi:hypothetical protein Tco_0889227 [Tanacetum coccineum]